MRHAETQGDSWTQLQGLQSVPGVSAPAVMQREPRWCVAEDESLI